MRTKEEISNKIASDYYKLTEKSFRSESALGFFTEAVSRSMEDAYTEIENSKNPHIYTNMDTTSLNKTGTFVGVPRETNESDSTYLYRIMNWTHLKAACNLTAINDSILNLKYASDAQYYPGIYGAGTGAIYIIPIEYSEDVIANAMIEVKDRLKNVISPESYTEYIVPTIIPIKLIIKIASDNGDLTYLKASLELAIKKYINAIAPGKYLNIGKLNKMGIETPNVDYFNVLGVYVNGDTKTDLKILQELNTKMLYDSISWETED